MSAQGTALMRPQLVSPRASKHEVLLEAVRGGNFDPDIWHIMESADDALIAEEVLYGPKSGVFVYDFKIKGDQAVQGISVIGAAHLARQYGGLRHKIVASVLKTGSLFVFTSYPHEGTSMQVHSSRLPDLEAEEDFYTAICEVSDIKTGNSVQMEKTEKRWEKTRAGEYYERPNFQVIAQSKTYRNGILRLVPQDVQAKFKIECLKLGKSKDMTEGLLEQKRQGVIAFLAKNALPVEREALNDLTMSQISGLSDAAHEGVPAFVNSAKALGLITISAEGEEEHTPAARAKPIARKPAPASPPARQIAPVREEPPPHDEQTGEIYEEEAGGGEGERQPEPARQSGQPAARRGGLFGKE